MERSSLVGGWSSSCGGGGGGGGSITSHVMTSSMASSTSSSFTSFRTSSHVSSSTVCSSSNVSFGESRSSSMKSDTSHQRVSTVSAGHKAAGPSTLFGVFESNPAGSRPLAPSAIPHSSTQPRSHTTKWSNTESDMKHLRSLRSSSTSKTTTSKSNVSKSNVTNSSKTQAINTKSSKTTVSSKSSLTKNDDKDTSVKSSGLSSAKSKDQNKSKTYKTVKLGDSRSLPASRPSNTRGTQTNKSERKSSKGNSKSVHTRDPHTHGAGTDTAALTKLQPGAKTHPNPADSKAGKTDIDNNGCPRVRYGETTKKGNRSVTAIDNVSVRIFRRCGEIYCVIILYALVPCLYERFNNVKEE